MSGRPVVGSRWIRVRPYARDVAAQTLGQRQGRTWLIAGYYHPLATQEACEIAQRVGQPVEQRLVGDDARLQMQRAHQQLPGGAIHLEIEAAFQAAMVQ